MNSRGGIDSSRFLVIQEFGPQITCAFQPRVADGISLVCFRGCVRRDFENRLGRFTFPAFEIRGRAVHPLENKFERLRQQAVPLSKRAPSTLWLRPDYE